MNQDFIEQPTTLEHYAWNIHLGLSQHSQDLELVHAQLPHLLKLFQKEIKYESMKSRCQYAYSVTIALTFALAVLSGKNKDDYGSISLRHTLFIYAIDAALMVVRATQNTPQEKVWLGEASFCIAYCFAVAEDLYQDLICDIFCFERQKINKENIEIAKFILYEKLVNQALDFDFDKNGFIPNYNEANGLNAQIFFDFQNRFFENQLMNGFFENESNYNSEFFNGDYLYDKFLNQMNLYVI